MDPWSTNEWVDPTPNNASSKLQTGLDLQSSDEHLTFPSSQPPWPVPDFSLPSWDNPSPPKPNSPMASVSPLGGSEKSVDQSTGTDLPTHSIPKQDLIPTIQTLALNTRPDSPANSFRTAGSVSSDQWAESNQSPLNEPGIRSQPAAIVPPTAVVTLSDTLPSISADLSHPTSDPDDVRWGSFTHTDIPPIPSTISFQPDPPAELEAESPAQSGWDGETNLSGWASGVAVDHSLPSMGTSVSIPNPVVDKIDASQIEKGWSSPHFSDNSCNQESGLEPPWDLSGSHPNQLSLDTGEQELEDEQWVQDQNHFHDSSQAATPVDANSNLSRVAELTGPSTEVSQNPLPDAPATRTEHMFQTSSPAEAFQSVISKTAQAAANALKSANSPRRFFGNQSAASQPSPADAISPEDPKNKSEYVAWGDFESFGAPPANPGETPTQNQQQSETKPRAGFFRLWTSKSPPTPKPSESKPDGESSISSPGPVLGRGTLSHNNSYHKPRDSVSSTSTSSTVWPAPSPVSLSPQQAPAVSTMSRLFGRFGSRSNIAPANADDQNVVTSPSTEIDANEAQFLDLFKTVPIEPQTGNKDDISTGKNIHQSKLNERVQTLKPQSDVFGFLSDHQDTPDLKSSLGSRQLSFSKSTSSPRGADPFDFINSASSSSSYHRHSMGPLSKSFSHPKNQLMRSGSAAAGKTSSEDDLDEIFAAFQGPGISAQAQGTGQVPKRLPTQSRLSPQVVQKPLMNHSSSSLGTTQVRMTHSPQPILRQNSIGSASSKIPMLPPPPPPSSSRANVPSPIPPNPRPQNKAPIASPPAFSSSNKILSPIPLIPPPQNSVNPSVQIPKVQSTASNSISPSQNQFLPFTALPAPHQTLPINTSRNHSRVPNPSGQGLSKEDLSFFDSLI